MKQSILSAAVLASAALASGCQDTGSAPAPAAASPPDHAEVEALQRADFRRVQCGQAIDTKELFDAVMIWVDGYAHGRAGRPATSQQEFGAQKARFITECERNRNATVQAVVVALNRPARRAAAPAATAPQAAPAAPTARPPAAPAR